MVMPRWSEMLDLVKKGTTLEAQQKNVELQASFIDLREENLR